MSLRSRRRAATLLAEVANEPQEVGVATEDPQSGSGSATSVVAEADGGNGANSLSQSTSDTTELGQGQDSQPADERAEAGVSVEVGEGTEEVIVPVVHPVDIPGSPRSKGKGRKKA